MKPSPDTIRNAKYHYVFGGPALNAHTHYMEDAGEIDFQIVLPVSQEMAVYILSSVLQWALDRIEPILPDTPYTNILPNQDGQPVPLQFMRARETGRPVWRVLIPDAEGKFRDEAAEDYNQQHLVPNS